MDTYLRSAAKNGDLRGLKHWIDAGLDVNAKNEESGNAAIHLCISSSRLEALILLLCNKNTDVNLLDKDNRTPLMLACRYSQTECVRVLLENNADPNILCKGISALHLAISIGNFEIVKLLVKYKCDINMVCETPPLLFAIKNRNEILKYLLENGADVNIRTPRGFTALHEAYNTDVNSVRILLKHNADVNVRSGSGKTPLHCHSSDGFPESVKMLIEHHSDINAIDENGNTALHSISNINPWGLEIIEILLDAGADANIKNNRGNTPLMMCVYERSSPKKLDLFIKKGIFPQREDFIFSKEEYHTKEYKKAYDKKSKDLIKWKLPKTERGEICFEKIKLYFAIEEGKFLKKLGNNFLFITEYLMIKYSLSEEILIKEFGRVFWN